MLPQMTQQMTIRVEVLKSWTELLYVSTIITQSF